MSRRRNAVLWAGLLIVVAVLGVVLLSRLWPHVSIGPEVYAQIKVGMTEKEVETVFGGPAGDYSTGPTVPGAVSPYSQHLVIPLDLVERAQGPICDKTWSGDANAITVYFDKEGRVAAKDIDTRILLFESPFARLRRCLGL